MTHRNKLKTRSVAAPALSGSPERMYEQAVANDRENIFGSIQAPSLFNWFVGLASIVAGLSLNLFSRFSSNIESSQFSAWTGPLTIIFVLAGMGLLLSETIGTRGKRAAIVFRLVLSFTFGALALVRFAGADFEGTFLTAWLAGVILFNVVADISSLRSWFIFFLGLFVGLSVVVFFSPLSRLSSFLLGQTGSTTMLGFVLLCLSLAYLSVTCVSYFKNKQIFTYLIGLAGLPLTGLAFIYANGSDWTIAFLVLLTALFAFLLPFWDELRFRLRMHRNWVAGMFLTLLGLFLGTILLIKVLQDILIANAYTSLADKVTYGRIQVESTINSSFSSVKSLAGSEVLVRALSGRRTEDLTDLSRGFFESNPNLLRIVVVDTKGKVLSAYPLTAGLVGKSLAGETYFDQVVVSEVAGVSNVVSSPLLEFSETTVAMSVPVMSSGRLVGMLIGFIDLRSMGDALQEIASPADDQAFVLIDAGGNWLTGPGVPAMKRAGDPLIAGLSQKGIIREGYSQDGELILAADGSVSTVSWRLVLIQPLFSALAVSQTAYVVILSMASLAVLIIGLTVLLERVGSHEDERQ